MFSCTLRYKLCQPYFLALLMSLPKLKRCGLLNNLISKGAERSFWSVSLFPPQDRMHRILLHFTHEASSLNLIWNLNHFLSSPESAFLGDTCRNSVCQIFLLRDLQQTYFPLWRALSANGIVVIN